MKILLVEDNEVNLRLTSVILESNGHEVTIVNDGQSAVEKVKTDSFNLILMDYKMPIMDGMAATKEIRKFNKDIPIIALTVLDSDDVKKKCEKAGMSDFLAKPVSPDQLNAILAKWG